MDYKDILKKVNSQENIGDINNKLYWYLGLIQAIELFSQKLNFDQIVYTCMDSINELLLVEKSAIYVKQENEFVLRRKKGYENCIDSITNSSILKDMPVLHAGLLNKNDAGKYFGTDLVQKMEVKFILPLIIEQDLFGFIIVGKKIIDDYNEDNFVLAEALMRLFNNALENFKKYEDIKKINDELDEKVFNLFAINQSSKVLLSELDINKLYTLAIDVFSELTQSTVTGFILLDRRNNLLSLKSYRNVFDVNDKVEMDIDYNRSVQLDPYRIILNVEDKEDIEYAKRLFPQYKEMIKRLKAKYLVLLLSKNEIIGIVTLGESVSMHKYKNSVFELIESLATSTYIAITNTELFKKVNEQNLLISRKLEKLIMLNTLVKNINSSKSLPIMSGLVLKTLDITYKVEKAVVAVYDEEKKQFNILETLGFKTKKRKIIPNDSWNRVFEGDLIFETGTDVVSKYIKEDIIDDIEEAAGIIISPISLYTGEDIKTYGAIIVFKYQDTLLTDEENRVIIQTISNHIAPIMASFKEIESKERLLLPNYIELFKDNLKTAIDESKKYNLDLEVLEIHVKGRFTFHGRKFMGDLIQAYKMVFPVSYENIFIITFEKNGNIENEIKNKIGQNIVINRHKFNKDFYTYEDFMSLY